MNVEAIVNDMKTRVEPLIARGQEAATVSAGTLSEAGDILVKRLQTLIDTEMAAGKDVLTAAQTSLEKVRTHGLASVMAAPVEYVPDVRGTVTSAYTEAWSLLTKTGGELGEVLKRGFDEAYGKFRGGLAETTAESMDRVQGKAKAVSRKAKSATADAEASAVASGEDAKEKIIDMAADAKKTALDSAADAKAKSAQPKARASTRRKSAASKKHASIRETW